MGAKYTTNSTYSGYNSSPPADDGSQVASNLITWAKHKTKLSDPIKTETTNIDNDLVTAFDYTPRRITTSDTVVADDHMRIVEISPSATTNVVVTLPDASATGTLFRTYIKNSSAHNQTISRTTGGDTIDGVAKDLVIQPSTSVCLATNNNASAVADGYIIASWFARQPLPAGIGPLPYAGSTVPNGWLECDGTAVSRTLYSNLYSAIGTTWGSGNGSTTFNLPKMAGRTIIGDGTGTTTEDVTNSDSNGFTVSSNNTKWLTGMTVVISNLTGFTTTLSTVPTYYVVRVSATNIRFASTLALAQAGTPDETISGTGTATITHTYTARTLGEYGGEQSHAMSITELLAHTHTLDSGTGGGGTILEADNVTGGTQQTTSSKGGNTAMNIMQPFAVTKFIISY